MSIIKVNTSIEEYRYRARSSDLNELSGRTNQHEVTLFVNKEIVKRMALCKGEVVVDIGCGDGTFLNLASEFDVSSIGILPTEEEVRRVQDRFSESQANIEIKRGLAHKTGLPGGFADKIVCNGVLLLLKEEEIVLALEEIVRISKNGALVYIGELPFVDEMVGRNYGNSIVKWLFWVLRNEGIRSFGNRAMQSAKGVFSKEPFIIKAKDQYFCPIDRFISKAERLNLNLVANFPHMTITPGGKLMNSESRQNYIFTVSR